MDKPILSRKIVYIIGAVKYVNDLLFDLAAYSCRVATTLGVLWFANTMLVEVLEKSFLPGWCGAAAIWVGCLCLGMTTIAYLCPSTELLLAIIASPRITEQRFIAAGRSVSSLRKMIKDDIAEIVSIVRAGETGNDE